MISRKEHILFLFPILLVTAGLLCLNLHDLTHLYPQQTDSHQTGSDSVPAKKMSDDCVLCVVSALGFADLAVQLFNAVQTETGQTAPYIFTSLSYRAVFVAAPRAPPVS